MTEHPESGTNAPPADTLPNESATAGIHDLPHPTSAEIADAVATSEEINAADEEYVAELAALDEPVDSPAIDTPRDGETGGTQPVAVAAVDEQMTSDAPRAVDTAATDIPAAAPTEEAHGRACCVRGTPRRVRRARRVVGRACCVRGAPRGARRRRAAPGRACRARGRGPSGRGAGHRPRRYSAGVG